MDPKIFIGVVTYNGKDYCLNRFADAIKSLDYTNYEIVIADNSLDGGHFNRFKEHGLNAIKTKHFQNPKDSLVDSRNTLRKIFLEDDFDYFFSVDSDILLPKDSINQLLEAEKKIISGVYYNLFNKGGKKIEMPILYTNLSKEELSILRDGLNRHNLPKKQREMFDLEFAKENPILRKQLLAEDVEGDEIITINLCGHGCLLIAREVIEKISFRYNKGFDDSMFCIDAEKLGYTIYARTGVKCLHIPSNNWDDIGVTFRF